MYFPFFVSLFTIQNPLFNVSLWLTYFNLNSSCTLIALLYVILCLHFSIVWRPLERQGDWFRGKFVRWNANTRVVSTQNYFCSWKFISHLHSLKYVCTLLLSYFANQSQPEISRAKASFSLAINNLLSSLLFECVPRMNGSKKSGFLRLSLRAFQRSERLQGSVCADRKLCGCPKRNWEFYGPQTENCGSKGKARWPSERKRRRQ